MRIKLHSEFSKRLITSLILIFLLIFLLYIGNLGIYLMIIVLCFLSFFEINNLRNCHLKLQYYIPFILFLYFFIIEIRLLNFSNQFLLLIFYILSSLLIIISLFQKTNIHFSIVGFLINSTFFSIIFIVSNHHLQYKLIFIIITIISLCDIFAYLIGKNFGKYKINLKDNL